MRSIHAEARGPDAAPLDAEITRRDALLVGAFNPHDLDDLVPLFSETLEFHHDTGGLRSYGAVEPGAHRWPAS